MDMDILASRRTIDAKSLDCIVKRVDVHCSGLRLFSAFEKVCRGLARLRRMKENWLWRRAYGNTVLVCAASFYCEQRAYIFVVRRRVVLDLDDEFALASDHSLSPRTEFHHESNATS